MKTFLTAIMMFFTSLAFSQSFKFTPEGLVNSDDSSKSYVVIKKDSLSAKDLFTRAVSYIQHTWKNPDIANSGKVEGEFLHVNTTAPDAVIYKKSLLKWSITIKYSIDLDFKDGKIKYAITNLEIYNEPLSNPAQRHLLAVKGGGLDWSIYNKDGSKCKLEEVRDGVEKYFNDQLTDFVTNISKDQKNSDW